MPRLFILAALSLCATIGCSSTAIDGSPPDLAPRVPLVHRPGAPTCPTDRSAFNCSVPQGQTLCQKDADCAAGTNGRCAGDLRGCHCSYDTCKTDADCAAKQLCDCRNQWHYGANGPNTCIASDCRVDADCGPKGYCSPSLDPQCGAFVGVTGWYCHTKDDECVDDRDCTGRVDGGFRPPFCGYHPEVHRWICSATLCAG